MLALFSVAYAKKNPHGKPARYETEVQQNGSKEKQEWG
jgi:hypothetical protein